MYMTKLNLLFLLVLLPVFATAANPGIERLEPANWWVGFKDKRLMLTVYGDNIARLQPSVDYPGVSVQRVTTVENGNYMFIHLHIGSTTQPGSFNIDFSADGKKIISHPYELWQKNPSPDQAKGFSSADNIYLITPDRFANGNSKNDNLPNKQDAVDRSDVDGRHGGDIQGIIDHLDYIEGMGYTMIWLNPVLENLMPVNSYHGYASTDFYRVDPRFGSNEEYRELAQRAKKKGIGIIMDMIVNHSGKEHWWLHDKPSADWFNLWSSPDGYGQTSHKHTTNIDMYASEYDRKQFADGWFVPAMPDLNQRNPLLAQYMIQNALWWIEYLGLAGIRMDTYPYPDKHYMTEWTRRVMEEYPSFNVVGEEWLLNPAFVSYWQAGKDNPDGYISYLPSLMDFPLQHALVTALNSSEPDALKGLYEMLVNDIVYPDPQQLVVFPDNHDMNRIITQLYDDLDLFKMAIGYVLTIRGVPQLYYGTEILMNNRLAADNEGANPDNWGGHGVIRSDFPGGWKGDKINAFTGKGLSKTQKEAQAFMKKLLHWRKGNEVISKGELIHFVPDEDTYVYFRKRHDQRVMVILNKNPTQVMLDAKRYAELINGYQYGHDVISGDKQNITKTIQVPARSISILEISR